MAEATTTLDWTRRIIDAEGEGNTTAEAFLATLEASSSRRHHVCSILAIVAHCPAIVSALNNVAQQVHPSLWKKTP